MQKVEEHYHKQGIMRGTPANQRSGMMQNFYSGTSYGMTESYDSRELDPVDHLYDTHEDEIRSAQLQLGRAQAQAQQFNMQQSQMAPSVQPKPKRCSTTAAVPANATYSSVVAISKLQYWSRHDNASAVL
jgi:hypothetical protein